MLVQRTYYAPQWADVVEPGSRVVSIDGEPVPGEPLTVTEVHADRLVFASLPGRVVPILYADSHESVLVEVDRPYVLSRREFYAIRRNPKYVALLESLLDGPRAADGRGEGVSLAALGTNYGWTERAPRYEWRITEKGRAALEALRAKRVAR